MKRNIYEIDKNIEKILRGQATGFLTLDISQELQKRLKKNDYKVLTPYKDADKVILSGGETPNIRLYKILCYEKDQLKHSSILGSLFGLNITNEMFGDIVFYEGNFYVYFLENICNIILEQFTMVGRIPIQLEEVDIHFLDHYERQYEKYEFIVTSERIDTIIARIIGCNREKVQDKIKEKLVFLNGEVLNRTSYLLHKGDIFSIRGYGKYKYVGIKGITKKNHFIILVKKYI